MKNDQQLVLLNQQPELASARPVASSALPENSFYHVVALSNFARAFDKYSCRYDKSMIPESTFSDRFFLLERDEISIGVNKVSKLLEKLKLTGNRLALLRVEIDRPSLKPNLDTGLGQYVDGASVVVAEVYIQDVEQPLGEHWIPVPFEVAVNNSLQLLYGETPQWDSVIPRSVSVLPIALGCQAKCNFCFSKASVSAEQDHEKLDFAVTEKYLRAAKDKGAERAVITGGGEPGLMKFDDLERLVSLCASHFNKVVMISNGYSLTKQEPAQRLTHLKRLHDAGLSVLSISRHHHCESKNFSIMNLETETEQLITTWRENEAVLQDLRLRLVCVLQKAGIATVADVEDYVGWAKQQGVDQVCFKELYVSTSSESVYHDSSYNVWSRGNQVPLKLVLDWAEQGGLSKVQQLPWGSPIFGGNGVDVAAYTEPSVYWELNNGMCRSWNVMADGSCFASLEDRRSVIALSDSPGANDEL